MSERHSVQTTYRGKVYSAEWYVEGSTVRLSSPLGDASSPIAGPGRILVPWQHMPLPSQIAAELLWRLARAADPKKPWFYWR